VLRIPILINLGETMKKLLLIFLLICATVAGNAAEIDDLRQERSGRSSQIERLKSSMFLYMLDHKLATASVIATGGGLGAFLQETMDSDTRAAIMIVGLFGLAYCVDNWTNAKECAAVTAELGSYFAKIDSHRKAIANIDSRMAMLTRPSQTPPVLLAPATVGGSDSKGPFFNTQFPNGFYVSNGAEIKLVLTTQTAVSKTLAKFDIGNFKKKAEEADSQLHNASEGFRYLLLEKDSLAVLKHTTTYRDYSEILDSKPGFGMEFFQNKDGWIQIAHVVRNSPAQAAGLEREDVIISIDGNSTKGRSADEVAALLKGEVGFDARLIFVKARDPAKPYQVDLKRAIVKFPTVKSVLGYIGIYRDSVGKFFYFRNDRDEYFDLPLGDRKSLTWNLDLASVSITFARPTSNADKYDREVDYLFSVK